MSQALAFATPPQTLTAAVPSAPIGVQLQTQGAAQIATAPLPVTLTSTSPSGTFALSPAGPWTSTLAIAIPAGSSTSQGLYYLDGAPGTPTLLASAANVLTGTQTMVVTPPEPAGRPRRGAQSRPRAAPKRAITRRGSAGRNVIVGGPRGDRLFGLGGNDLLRGRAGNDHLDGGRGLDRVFGDTGADLVIGGPGRDRLVGGRGADRIRARDRQIDVINCGPGRDQVVADRRDRISRNCEVRIRK
jgi:RTX calcium-binding nonapeptide repeat (4 copies)